MRSLSIVVLALGTLAGLAVVDSGEAHAAGTLYLNRCAGGCVIHKSGLNDARTHSSYIPEGTATDYPMTEFAWGDVEWNAIVQCMKEVYSPYDVTITDVLPAPGVPYNESIIAGSDNELGVSAGGIAPTGGCTTVNYSTNFTFANQFGPGQRVFQLCAVAAQESGHSYGLDHTYSFLDGSSGCRDPLTYRSDCGGQKFFRNEVANCGRFGPETCNCGGTTQQAHLKLLTELGPGTPITSPPTVSVQTPADGATVVNGAFINATAYAQRGVKTMELWINGYKWATAKGAAFGPNGQLESQYPIPLPAAVPDGILDIIVKAKDDIDITTSAPMITVTKGAPCATADSCAKGQRCDAGRCLWDPAVGELGEDCTFPQFCLSNVCSGTSASTICTQECIVGVGDSCPMDYECIESGPGKGVCLPASAEDPGCCSASNDAAAQSALVAMALAFLIRRRRR